MQLSFGWWDWYMEKAEKRRDDGVA